MTTIFTVHGAGQEPTEVPSPPPTGRATRTARTLKLSDFFLDSASKLRFHDTMLPSTLQSLMKIADCAIDSTPPESVDVSVLSQGMKDMQDAELDCYQLYSETAFELFKRWMHLNYRNVLHKRKQVEEKKEAIRSSCRTWEQKVKRLSKRDHVLQRLEERCAALFRSGQHNEEESQFHRMPGESLLQSLERYIVELPECTATSEQLQLARDIFMNHSMATSTLIRNTRQRNDTVQQFADSECKKAMREHDVKLIQRELHKRELMRKKLYSQELGVFTSRKSSARSALLREAQKLYAELLEHSAASSQILQWKLKTLVDSSCEEKLFECQHEFEQFSKNLHKSSLEKLRQKLDKLAMVYEKHMREMNLDRNIYIESSDTSPKESAAFSKSLLQRRRVARNDVLRRAHQAFLTLSTSAPPPRQS